MVVAPLSTAPQAASGDRAHATDTTGGRLPRSLVMSPLSLSPTSRRPAEVPAGMRYGLVKASHAGGSVGHGLAGASFEQRGLPWRTIVGHTRRDAQPVSRRDEPHPGGRRWRHERT